MKENMQVYDVIIRDLEVVKFFLKRKEYKRLWNACSFKMPRYVLLNARGHQCIEKPSPVEFMKSIYNLSLFVQGMDDAKADSCEEEATKDDMLRKNSQGYHSLTVIECMNKCFVNQEYKSIEEMCYMIDPNDENEDDSVKRIWNNIMNCRSNLTARNLPQ